MSDILTIEEIYARFPDEWILLDEPQTHQTLGVRAGKVLAHSKDRDEVDRQAIALRPRHFAMLYTDTGTMPEDTEFVL